jgi:hypothetical protein
MSVIYPLHFHRRVDRLWTLREKHQRLAHVFTTIDRPAVAAVSADGGSACKRSVTSTQSHRRRGP